MISGNHTVNRSHQPCVDVTPPGSASSHRTGLEPGFPAREAGDLTRNAKGYSLQRLSLERLFLRSGEWGLHTAFTGIHICYIDIPQWVLTRHLSDEPPYRI